MNIFLRMITALAQFRVFFRELAAVTATRGEL